MTKLQNIRKELKSIIESVPDIGKVYPYYRYKKNDLKETLNLFKVKDDFKGIMFRELACTEPVTDEDNEKTRKWEMTMINQVNDEKESQILFEDRIEVLLDTVNENSTLNNSIREHNNLQLIDISERVFGDVLCHEAILNLETIETI